MSGRDVQLDEDAPAHRNELLRQQQIYLVQRVPIMSVVNSVNGSFVAGLYLLLYPSTAMAIWWSLMVGGSLIQFIGWLKIRKRPVPAVVSGRSLRRAEGWSFLMGGLWGALALIGFPPGDMPMQMFTVVMLGGMSAGVATILAPLPRLTARFIIASLVPLIVQLLIAGEPIHYALAGIASLYVFTLINGSIWSYDQFAELIHQTEQQRQTQSHLVNAIESTNDAFAIFAPDGRLAVFNRRFSQWFPSFTSVEDLSDSEMRFRQVGERWVIGSLRPIPGGGFVSVHTDVTELKEREAALIEANARAEAARQQAEEASRAKTEFLANMSHELRTPLNAIMGFSEVMKEELFGALGHEKYKQYSADILSSATHLLSIIGDILDLSKIESHNYKIDLEPVDARAVIDWVVKLCQQRLVMEDGRVIEKDIAADLGVIHADERALRQILLNLLNNALKFTPLDGRVGIQAEVTADEELAICVWDTGIGIPKDKINWVRQPFRQFEGVFHKKYQGTGLGLSISDALVGLHGGRLEIESELNEGTKVRIFLPLKAHPSALSADPASADLALQAAG